MRGRNSKTLVTSCDRAWLRAWIHVRYVIRNGCEPGAIRGSSSYSSPLGVAERACAMHSASACTAHLSIAGASPPSGALTGQEEGAYDRQSDRTQRQLHRGIES